MGIISSLRQNRLQSVIGPVDTPSLGFPMFAIERSKRLIFDVPFALIGATVLWSTVLNPGVWSVVQLPVIWLVIIAVYLLGGGWI